MDALDRLEQFLDAARSEAEHAEALNDASLSSPLILSFLRSLGDADLHRALYYCRRPLVLAAAAAFVDYDGMAEILGNPATPRWVLINALDDGADEGLRLRIAATRADDVEITAGLLADPSHRVRAAIGEALDAVRREDDRAAAERPGPPESLAWLHLAVPATDVEDQLEARARRHRDAAVERIVEELARTGDLVDAPEPTVVPVEEPASDPELDEAKAVIELVFRPDRPWDPR